MAEKKSKALADMTADALRELKAEKKQASLALAAEMAEIQTYITALEE